MVKFSQVGLKYQDKVIFKDLSVEIKTGEKVLLFAPSGFGKTSFLRLILGFALPFSGEIFFAQKKISCANIFWVRKQIAYLDQDLSLAHMEVDKWFDFVFSLKANASLKPTLEDVERLFAYFELRQDIRKKNIFELSGGERQRIGLITALLLRRPFFLLDEPTAFLDKHLKEKTVKIFTQSQSTLLVASHDNIWQEANLRVFDMEEKKWRA